MPSNAPVGGTLVNRVLNESDADQLKSRASDYPAISVSPAEVWDLKLIAIGGYSPLTGFMKQEDYASVIARGRLKDGNPWTVPITLSVDDATKDALKVGAPAALRDEDGNLLGEIHVSGIYPRQFKEEAEGVFRTSDEKHPGVERIKQAGQWLVAGDVNVLPETLPADEQGMEYRPAAVRAEIEKRGWNNVVAFQTRNPIHRAHEHLIRVAMETADGLLIHPLVGETKAGDIPADVRTACYKALIEKYFPADRVILAALPAPMRYAGPKEAIHHALMRRNYGANQFIVGRDHAGVGDYYGTYDAQQIFETYEPGELGISNLNFEHSFWCKGVGGYATTKTSPFGPEQRIFVSGTKLREMLGNGEHPPEEVVRPEIADILIEYYKTL
ncbi:MAG: sulfate adenylyltransferase [Planctomycetes bacterium]|nr:sulfate adenylyltransferase [Planctomycetota bacterium]